LNRQNLVISLVMTGGFAIKNWNEPTKITGKIITFFIFFTFSYLDHFLSLEYRDPSKPILPYTLY